MLIVDAHLDLAYNALRGRKVGLPASQQPRDKDGIPSVGLPDLRAGAVGLICATLFCEPFSNREPAGYRSEDEANAMALRQMAWYLKQEEAGEVEIVGRGEQLPADDAEPSSAHHPIPIVILMEGADPLRNEEDVVAFHAAGMRIVGLAWHRTRHAGGTGEPGPLTAAGRILLSILDKYRIIHDLSHLAEESFWELLDYSGGPLIATHSNCRAIVPTDRHLTDEMLRALFARGGVCGINFFDKFLIPPHDQGQRRATLDDVILHMRHMCEIAGTADHVAIGTDMDGGFDQLRIPEEIRTCADLPRLAEALSHGGFADGDVRKILGGNWLRFFRQHLG